MDIRKTARDGLAADKKKKASYSDIRYEIIRDRNLSYTDGTPDPVEESLSAGWAVRVLVDGAWGFASSDAIDSGIGSLVEQAVVVARASAMVMKTPVTLSTVKPETGEYRSTYTTDPFTVPVKEVGQFLSDLAGAMAAQTSITSHNCFASFRKLEKWFFSSEGSELHQIIIQTGGGIGLTQAKSRRERAERSYPTSSGQYQTSGYELLAELDMKSRIPLLAEEVGQLIAAPPCPQKTTTMVLSGDMMSLVIHESIGHPLELDRVFGSERNFSGTSFATTDQLGKLQYGSPLITVTSDPTASGGLGSFGWDDEGVKSHEAGLVTKGILTGYLSSRETAARIGADSTGAMRAEGWKNIPLVRMTNINLEPGDKTFAQLIGDIDDGIYMATPSSWSIDDLRKNFQFGCEIGWEIKGGKLAGVVKNPTFSGCTTLFWNSCDAIGDAAQFKIWGTPNCGKGQPGQNARTGQGASPARFVGIQVGG